MDSRLLATFRSAPSTLGPTPGVREAWHQGRSVYAVWVLRVLDAPILERMALVNARLAPHGVRPFGEAHVTVFVAGFPARAPGRDDDVSIDALLAPLGTVGWRRPRLLVGAPSSFRSCPILAVADPDGGLAALRAPLSSHMREVRFAPYEPHITLGLYADSRPTVPIADTLESLAGLAPLPWSPRALELVLLDPTDPTPLLRTVASLPLSG